MTGKVRESAGSYPQGCPVAASATSPILLLEKHSGLQCRSHLHMMQPFPLRAQPQHPLLWQEQCNLEPYWTKCGSQQPQTPSLAVWRCRFYYYSGLVKPTNQETVCRWNDSSLQFPRVGQLSHHTGPHRSVRRQRERETMGKSLKSGFHSQYG